MQHYIFECTLLWLISGPNVSGWNQFDRIFLSLVFVVDLRVSASIDLRKTKLSGDPYSLWFLFLMIMLSILWYFYGYKSSPDFLSNAAKSIPVTAQVGFRLCGRELDLESKTLPDRQIGRKSKPLQKQIRKELLYRTRIKKS